MMRQRKFPNSTPDRHLKMMVGAHLVWLSTVCLLGGWWGKLVLNQAAKIVELESRLGVSSNLTQGSWQRTERMVYWESASFFVLLLACTALLFWIYWRDVTRSRGIRAFFASVTHELRTPLTSIRLQAESIADLLEANDSKRNLVQRLLEDAIRLEGQVEKTLELSRIEGGGPVFTQPLEVKPWIERFLKTWKQDYQDRVEIETQLDDVLIEADSTAFQVILKNLLENSVRHSKKDRVRVLISMSSDSSRIGIQIQDNGEGYSGDIHSLGKIFQKGPMSQGTGVGLYLVKALMQKMGGTVQFRLIPGFSTTLWFQEGKSHG
jgi:signal transduction histidine kinase